MPQEFYNVDSMQHREEQNWEDASPGEAWHEQQLFYRVIQPGKNRWNAAFWCASPSVLRRTALLDVGGVATGTVTEDLHTSIRLHARGWKTVYHDECLAFGIAPQTPHAFRLQRLRWAQGTMQLLRSRENSILIPGLSLAQRLNYIGSTFTYFESYQKLLYLLTPAFVLLTGVLPLRVSGGTFLLHWAPAILLGALANIALGRGYFQIVQVDRFNVLKMFTFVRASVTLVWPSRVQFRVTPKRAVATVAEQERRLVLPHLVSLAFIAVTVVVSLANLRWALTARYGNASAIAVTLVWAFVNAGLLTLAVTRVLRRHHARQDYRFPLELVATLATRAATVAVVACDLSLSGSGVMASAPLPTGRLCSVTLPLPDGALTLEGEVIRGRRRPGGLYHMGIRLNAMPVPTRRRLITLLYVTLPRAQTSAPQLAAA